MAGAKERRGRENLTFRCPRVLREWLNGQVATGEFSSVSEAVVYYLTVAKARQETCEG